MKSMDESSGSHIKNRPVRFIFLSMQLVGNSTYSTASSEALCFMTKPRPSLLILSRQKMLIGPVIFSNRSVRLDLKISSV